MPITGIASQPLLLIFLCCENCWQSVVIDPLGELVWPGCHESVGVDLDRWTILFDGTLVTSPNTSKAKHRS